MLRGGVFLLPGRQEVGPRINAHEQFVLAKAKPVAILQFDRSRVRRRVFVFVHEYAIRARVAQPVGAVAELDLAVVAGDDALLVGQHPVIVRCTADRSAIHTEDARAVLAEFAILVADDA